MVAHIYRISLQRYMYKKIWYILLPVLALVLSLGGNSGGHIATDTHSALIVTAQLHTSRSLPGRINTNKQDRQNSRFAMRTKGTQNAAAIHSDPPSWTPLTNNFTLTQIRAAYHCSPVVSAWYRAYALRGPPAIS